MYQLGERIAAFRRSCFVHHRTGDGTHSKSDRLIHILNLGSIVVGGRRAAHAVDVVRMGNSIALSQC